MIDNIETICANSYRNFHAKGMDYLCLFRRENLTVKAYFFDGNLDKLPEIVVPHNHRYAFITTVIAGALSNLQYHACPPDSPVGSIWHRFDYMTPLNGGDGFSYAGDSRVICDPPSKSFKAWQSYNSRPTDIHTLRIDEPGTVALLFQYEDELALDQPTQAWVPAYVGEIPKAPSITGLYDRMLPDHALARIKILQQLGAIT